MRVCVRGTVRLCAHECVQVCASQEHTCVNAGCSRCRKSNPSCRGWRGRFSLPALHGQGPCAQLRRSCGSQRLHREQTAEVTGAAQLGAGLSRNLRALLQEAAPGPLAVRVPRRGTLGALTQARLSAAGPGPLPPAWALSACRVPEVRSVLWLLLRFFSQSFSGQRTLAFPSCPLAQSQPLSCRAPWQGPFLRSACTCRNWEESIY